MDDVIFEEFKGTGNMEVVLDRKLADKRIFPAIDINRSGTRKEELLMTAGGDEQGLDPAEVPERIEPMEAMEFLIGKMNQTKTNKKFSR
jgi:transcription termination factor Rho